MAGVTGVTGVPVTGVWRLGWVGSGGPMGARGSDEERAW